ncbi:MAG: cellulase family glycosylhydrolase [Verrucomicrobiota bacterium]
MSALSAAEARPGLTVEQGVLSKDGQPYRGVGVNYFSAFLRTVLQPTNTTYREGFAVLGQHKIPFARFAACGFWPSDWQLYQTNRALYFKLLDDVVRTAEENHVGLIPSLFWRVGTLCELAGEPHRAWGDPASQTHQLMRRYTEEVVTRYRLSPAIWGWEFANEFSLDVDLPNAKQLLEKHKAMPRLGVPQGTEADLLSAAMMVTALQEFAKTVRKFDTYRLIISGNSEPRPGAWHNTAEKSWTTDTREQFMQVLARDNPDPISTLCVHVYPSKDKRFSKEHPASQLDVLRAMMAASQQTRKPLFVGEFGASKELGPEAERQTFGALLGDLQTAGVPLAALWVFDLPAQNKDWNVTATNERAYMLKLVAEANVRTR